MLTPELEQRICKLLREISAEFNPARVQVLAAELRSLLTAETLHTEPTDRQLRIIELVAEGLKNREIAQRLGVRAEVVRNYISRIFSEIGVNNRIELALWYERQVHEGKIERRVSRFN